MKITKVAKGKSLVYLIPEGDVDKYELGKLSAIIKPIYITASSGGHRQEQQNFDGVCFDIFSLIDKISMDKLAYYGEISYIGVVA